MSTVVIATAGTCGDLFPYLALGRELVNRGHHVRMAVSEPLLHHVYEEGLDGYACRPAMGSTQVAQNAKDWDHWISHPCSRFNASDAMPGLDLDGRFEDLVKICHGAEYFLCSPVQFIGQCIHDTTGIPWLTVSVMPFLHSRKTCAKTTSANASSFEAPIRAYVGVFNAFLQRHHLPQRTMESFMEPAMSSSVVLAASRLFYDPTEGGVNPEVSTTGFCYYTAPSWSSWRPDRDLSAFMDSDPAPLALTFSSLPLVDPARTVQIHAEAAKRLGRRLLILNGWAGFREEHLPSQALRRDVFMAEYLPHEWVFQKAAAVIHHGGIGTTARCLQQGCPMLIEPYGNDQFFNAQHMLRHGLGAAMHPHRLSVAEVTRVLAEKVLTDCVQDRAKRFAKTLHTENGIANTGDFVEQWMAAQ